MTEARLYYEAHITVKGQDMSVWSWFTKLAEDNGMRASRFEVDEVDHYDGAWFLSYRSTSLNVMKFAIRQMLSLLRERGVEPIRWKIEDTILDSKHGDLEQDLVA